jgi:hypothetical protein
VLRSTIEIHDLNSGVVKRFNELRLAFVTAVAQSELPLVVDAPAVDLSIAWGEVSEGEKKKSCEVFFFFVSQEVRTRDGEEKTVATLHFNNFFGTKFLNEGRSELNGVHPFSEIVDFRSDVVEL